MSVLSLIFFCGVVDGGYQVMIFKIDDNGLNIVVGFIQGFVDFYMVGN